MIPQEGKAAKVLPFFFAFLWRGNLIDYKLIGLFEVSLLGQRSVIFHLMGFGRLGY